MSRNAHFGIGIAVGIFGWFWVMCLWFMFWGRGIQTDSRSDTFYSDSFIIGLIIWGTGFLGILWAIRLCLKRTFRPPRLDTPPQAPTPLVAIEQQQELRTPDEKLAHLVRKTDT
jgi:hypothetical protein